MQQQVSVWDYLKHQLQVLKLEIADETAQQVPFDFWGGYVGYLGYELKAECGGEHAHQAPRLMQLCFWQTGALLPCTYTYMDSRIDSCMNMCTADASHWQLAQYSVHPPAHAAINIALHVISSRHHEFGIAFPSACKPCSSGMHPVVAPFHIGSRQW